MFPTPNFGEVYYIKEEYDCSNPICSNYGVVIERRLTWINRFSTWIDGLKQNVTNIARSLFASMVAASRDFKGAQWKKR